MTNSEFKAWFDGFTEAIDKTPTIKQWARIKARVKEINGSPVTYPVYVDRYWPTVRPYWGLPYGGYAVSGNAASAGNMQANNNAQSLLASVGQNQTEFDSSVAMHALGRAEAMN